MHLQFEALQSFPLAVKKNEAEGKFWSVINYEKGWFGDDPGFLNYSQIHLIVKGGNKGGQGEVLRQYFYFKIDLNQGSPTGSPQG